MYIYMYICTDKYTSIYTHTWTQGSYILGNDVLKSIKAPESSEINCGQEASGDNVLIHMFPLWGVRMFICNAHQLVHFLYRVPSPNLSLQPDFRNSV